MDTPAACTGADGQLHSPYEPGDPCAEWARAVYAPWWGLLTIAGMVLCSYALLALLGLLPAPWSRRTLALLALVLIGLVAASWRAIS